MAFATYLRRTLLSLPVAALVVGCATTGGCPPEAEVPLVAEAVFEKDRDPRPEGLSDLTAIGGNRYLSVDDRGGMLHELEIELGGSGAVRHCKAVRGVRLEGRTDLEGCAFDPLDGRVWVTDEHDTSIRQFDPATGEETAKVLVPEVFGRHAVRNRSFESIAITPDGLRMYVANEDTLACDGAGANRKSGGVVRIQEFTRTGKGAPWTAARQFRYRTEKVGGGEFAGVAVSGVVALIAAEDGSLLVLEREMSKKNPLFPSFRARLFEVRPDADRSDELAKRVVWDRDTMFANYEGACFGPRLKDGSRSIILVSDGGGPAKERVLVLALRPPR